jgi:hypothetical protein
MAGVETPAIVADPGKAGPKRLCAPIGAATPSKHLIQRKFLFTQRKRQQLAVWPAQIGQDNFLELTGQSQLVMDGTP